MAGMQPDQAPVDSETKSPPPSSSSSSSSSSTSNTIAATTSTALTNEPPAVSGRLTISDAEAYLNKVKEVFSDQRGLYMSFLRIMRDFKGHRLCGSGTAAKVKELFEGRNDLITGFNTFLPKRFKITVTLDEAPPTTSRLHKLKDFMRKTEDRFEAAFYVEILDLFIKYLRKDELRLKVEVTALLQGHPDLLEDLNDLLILQFHINLQVEVTALLQGHPDLLEDLNDLLLI